MLLISMVNALFLFFVFFFLILFYPFPVKGRIILLRKKKKKKKKSRSSSDNSYYTESSSQTEYKPTQVVLDSLFFIPVLHGNSLINDAQSSESVLSTSRESYDEILRKPSLFVPVFTVQSVDFCLAGEQPCEPQPPQPPQPPTCPYENCVVDPYPIILEQLSRLFGDKSWGEKSYGELSAPPNELQIR